ncbi:Basic helix-loop-helix transcription factor [Parasponia andersonii]|uniref:Basic helix-loop-helix transcription factor n=1 Tax=Parasponia andersonii TaxID=3476 RepID=A0A2P5AH98_PARAD|nr:Basic helix-loop-helix transcription factor [Parasponia andersonii]
MRLREVEWFRPLIGAQQWDYIVVWKLGDEPSRFIEWMGCCCRGSIDCGNVKEEKSEENHLNPLCRDDYMKHLVRTKACKELAQLPTYMPLYSGVHHIEVLLSSQPRWLSQVDSSDSKPSHDDSGGTRALVPVEGGLIELYCTKHIAKEPKVLELVLAHCNISLEKETMARNICSNERPNKGLHLDSLTEQWPFSSHLLSLSSSLQARCAGAQSSSHTSIEGSSRTGSSNPPNEHMLFDSSCVYESQSELFEQSIEKCSSSHKLGCNGNFLAQLAQQEGSVRGHEAEKSATKTIRKNGEECHSKNLHTERNRRFRIQNGILTLRSLVPKITKLDKTSTLVDAINYIKELQKEEKELQDELKKMEEEDYCHKNKNEYTITKPNKSKEAAKRLLSAGQNQSSTFGTKQQIVVHVEVNQIGKREFFIKLLRRQSQDGFVRLMEALDSLELQVISANLTTFNGIVQNILEVKAEKDIQPEKLRSALIELTG